MRYDEADEADRSGYGNSGPCQYEPPIKIMNLRRLTLTPK